MALIASCGRTALDGADYGSTPDAEASAPACDPSAPFVSIEPVPGVIDAPGYDSDIRLTPNELTAYFVSDRARDSGVYGGEVFVARRASVDQPFANATLVPGLANPNSTAEDPNVTADELNVVFTGSCFGVFDDPVLCGARRSSTAANFGAPFVINAGESSKPIYGGEPYLSHDGTVLYFDGRAFAGHGDGIGRAARAATTDDFGPIDYVGVDGADGGIFDLNPVVTDDELVLYFSRYLPPSFNAGAIWFATRANTSVPFANAHPVAELASPLDAYPNWISPDGCRLYFTREVATADGGSQPDIFVASK
ncbi:MAG TPA: hypothetical protein VGH28_03465 [Polyangiaceae bacterium]